MPDYLTWQAFKDEVLALMPMEKSRIIAGDDGTLLTRLTRQAVIDLQDFIPVYRKQHETLYQPFDFVTEGVASRAVMPPFAQFRDAWLVNSETGVRYPLKEMDWEQRFEMTTGRVDLLDSNGLICIDRAAYTFYVYPEVTDGLVFSVFWDGLKSEFDDAEEVPFCEGAVEAAADFVKGKLARDIEHDTTLYESYFRNHSLNPGSYILKRRNLWLTAKERTRLK